MNSMGLLVSWILCIHCVFGQSVFRSLVLFIRSEVKVTAPSIGRMHGWELEDPLDGNIGPDPDICHCCFLSHYQDTFPVWWQLDLGKPYPISVVEVYGRADDLRYTPQSQNFTIATSDRPMSGVKDGNPCQSTFDRNSSLYIANFNPSRKFQYLIVGRENNAIMTVCEVRIIQESLIQRIKADVKTSVSSSYELDGWNKANVIDNVSNFSASTCGCCFATNSATQTKAWWQINLGQTYKIFLIEVYGRTDGSHQQFANLLIATNNRSMADVTDGYLVNATYDSQGLYFALLRPSIVFQYLLVGRTTTELMTLCEVKVYNEPVDDCASSPCQGNSLCEETHDAYRCVCPPGQYLQGNSSCIECRPGFYGINCLDVCGNCSLVTECDNVNGTCSGSCKPGYMGIKCTETCTANSFGQNCSQECGNCKAGTTCNHIDGECGFGCVPGFNVSDVFCNTPCTDGTFGADCLENCGHCWPASCDTTDGHCPNGCDKGYHGTNCNQECDGSYFGHNCTHECHCKRKSGWTCDRFVGNCSHGCDIGWMGFNCSIDTNIVKPNTSVTLSSVHSAHYSADKLVDGRIQTGRREQVYEACTATSNVDNPWIELNFGAPYLVQYIRLYGRTDGYGTHQGHNLDIFVDNQTMHNATINNGTYIATVNVTNTNRVETVEIELPRILQYIIIRRWRPSIITLCEVKVYETDCVVNKYGDKCTGSCNCDDDKNCNIITGVCQSPGCKQGWKGESCNTACNKGLYGKDCNNTCHCKNNTDCNIVNGTCWPGGCDTGWVGDSCSLAFTHPDDDDDDYIGITAGIIGGIVAGVFVLLVIVAVVMVYKVRTKKKLASEEPVQLTNGAIEVNATVTGSKAVLVPEVDQANEYCNAETITIKRIKVTNLWKYVNDRTKEGSDEFDKEFAKLPSGLQFPHTIGGQPELKPKNRYKDMYAYDHSRVVLQTDSQDETDYINACYIDGYSTKKKFIAAQGPTKGMIDDFWRMTWQEKSDKIVMLTKLIEMGTQKCIQYWPEKVGETTEYLNINVKLVHEETLQDYIIRDLEVNKGNGQSRNIRQYHFMAWPDKDVPDNAWCLVNFWRTVDTSATDKTIIVHCSAGVGRTGTFIAMDNLVEQAASEGYVGPLQVVENLRKQRLNMVQTRNQYAYLHEAVAEALLIGTHHVDFKHFEYVYRYMTDVEATRNRIAQQLDLINESQYDTALDETVEAVEYSNVIERTASRDEKCGMLHDSSPKLSAYFVPDFMEKNSVILCKTPAGDNMEDIITLIMKHHIITVIMASTNMSQDHKALRQLGDEGFDQFGQYQVALVQEKTYGTSVKERTLSISHAKQQDVPIKIKHFEFSAWAPASEIPTDPQAMLELLDTVQRWQSDLMESKPVLIHCTNGYEQSGVVAVLLNELQRMKIGDGNINLVESVFTMKQRHDGIVHSEEQLRYCYDVISAHVERMKEIYQNL